MPGSIPRGAGAGGPPPGPRRRGRGGVRRLRGRDEAAARDRRGEGGPRRGDPGGRPGGHALAPADRRGLPGGRRARRGARRAQQQERVVGPGGGGADGGRGLPRPPPRTCTSTSRALGDEHLARELFERTEGLADAVERLAVPDPRAGPWRRGARPAARPIPHDRLRLGRGPAPPARRPDRRRDPRAGRRRRRRVQATSSATRRPWPSWSSARTPRPRSTSTRSSTAAAWWGSRTAWSSCPRTPAKPTSAPRCASSRPIHRWPGSSPRCRSRKGSGSRP